jgi:hypothetical protein
MKKFLLSLAISVAALTVGFTAVSALSLIHI